MRCLDFQHSIQNEKKDKGFDAKVYFSDMLVICYKYPPSAGNHQKTTKIILRAVVRQLSRAKGLSQQALTI